MNPLFLGLTRPALVFGVSFIFFGMNVIMGLMYFVVTSDFKVVPVVVAAHIFGMMITKKEPLAIEILLLKMQKTNNCKNRTYYGGLNSYEVF